MKEDSGVRCQKCGGLLDVVAESRFVACKACGAMLEVFTRLVKDVVPAGEDVHAELTELKRQNELLRLEAEWKTRRQSLMWRSRRGYYEPTYGGVATTVFLFGLVPGFVLLTNGASCFWLLLPLAAGTGFGMMQAKEVKTFETARNDYLVRRERLAGKEGK